MFRPLHPLTLIAFLISASLTGTLTAAEPEPAAETAAKPVVRLETSLGNIDIELHADEAPETVANFLDLVDTGFYEGMVFHRVVAGFVIQAGGYDHKLSYRSPPRTVVNESNNGLRNQKYSVAMARLADPTPPTASSSST